MIRITVKVFKKLSESLEIPPELFEHFNYVEMFDENTTDCYYDEYEGLIEIYKNSDYGFMVGCDNLTVEQLRKFELSPPLYYTEFDSYEDDDELECIFYFIDKKTVEECIL